MKFFFVGFFGLLGVYLRYFMDKYYIQSSGELHYATLINNTLGCLVAGIIYALVVHKGENPLTIGILTGFCGGLTTFSGFNLHILKLFNQDMVSKSLLYFILSPSIGLAVLLLGFYSTQKFIN